MDSAFAKLNGGQQDKWRSFSRRLADYHYDLGARSAEQGQVANSESAFAQAATYYEGLAPRVGQSGEVLRLAGDARLQAGHFPRALDNFRKAAYEAPGYSEAADAAWAAVTLLRDGVDQQNGAAEFRPGLQDLSVEANRFNERFAGDNRGSGLMADLAARWLAAGNHERGLHYASLVLTALGASPAERYATWQVTARIRQKEGDFGLAERAWNQALDLAESDQLKDVTGDQLAAIRRQLATAVYRQGKWVHPRASLERLWGISGGLIQCYLARK